MEKKIYLLLLALDQRNARLGRAVLATIKARIDPAAAPAFLHKQGAGIFMRSNLSSFEVWQQVWPTDMTEAENESLRDTVILQLGDDHAGLQQAKPIAWLIKHTVKAQQAG